MFLWFLCREQSIGERLRRLARRTTVAAVVALTISCVNILILALLEGKQLGWVCLSSCAADVGRAFNARMDKYTVPSQHYVAGLLERGVRVLIYSGTYDWQCTWYASKLWLEKLEWSGSAVYSARQFRNWIVDGRPAGETKTAGPLTFATVRGAGHMMSTDVLIGSRGWR